MWSYIYVLVITTLVVLASELEEPTCLSRYDYDFKLLKTMVDLKKCNDELRETVQQQAEELARISAIVTTTKPVAFYAQLTSDITAIKNHQTLNFDKVMINLGNGYNGVSGVFAAPASGLYVFHWVNTNRDRSYMNTELIVRNQVYGKAMSDAMDHNDYAVASNLAVVQLEPGDQVWVRSGTWHSGKLAGDYYSTFSGYRLQ